MSRAISPPTLACVLVCGHSSPGATLCRFSRIGIRSGFGSGFVQAGWRSHYPEPFPAVAEFFLVMPFALVHHWTVH